MEYKSKEAKCLKRNNKLAKNIKILCKILFSISNKRVLFKRKRQKSLAHGTLKSKGGKMGVENRKKIYQVWMPSVENVLYQIPEIPDAAAI